MNTCAPLLEQCSVDPDSYAAGLKAQLEAMTLKLQEANDQIYKLNSRVHSLSSELDDLRVKAMNLAVAYKNELSRPKQRPVVNHVYHQRAPEREKGLLGELWDTFGF